MAVAISSVVRLNGPQIGEFVSILLDAFDQDELEQAVRFRLNLVVANEFPTVDKGLKAVAYALVSGLNRRDRVGELLDAVAQERPHNEALPQFVARVGSGASTAERQAGVVGEAIKAAATLANADGSVQSRLAPLKPWLEVTREELDRLDRYKALHDCLHTLQLQLPALNRAARDFPRDAAARVELRSYGEQFRRLAAEAARNVNRPPDLPSQEDEQAWLADFESGLLAYRDALAGPRSDPLEGAARALGRLTNEAERINRELTRSAKNLQLGRLTEALRGLLDLPDPAIASRLRPGHVALLGLIPQLDGLVDAHDGWQRLDRGLVAAAKLSGPPAERVPRWGQLRPLLALLCPARTEPDPMADPLDLAGRWEAAADPAEAENCFLSLEAAARHKFYDVDRQLLDLTRRLAELVTPLDALLKEI